MSQTSGVKREWQKPRNIILNDIKKKNNSNRTHRYESEFHRKTHSDAKRNELFNYLKPNLNVGLQFWQFALYNRYIQNGAQN